MTLFRLTFQCDSVCRLLLPAVNAVKILLRGGEVLVTDKFLYGIGICPCLKLQRAEGVAARMVGDMLGDARCLYPLLKCCLCHAVLEAGKYKSLSFTVVYQCQRLVSYRVVDNLLCLLHTVGDIECAVGFGLDHFPCEWLDIAFSQSCKT